MPGRAATALFVIGLCACDPGSHAYAGRVASRSDLVGGPRAIGDLGDWRISNGRVRFIVQDLGNDRVYATFGGSLIDADLARPVEVADPRLRPSGRDGLGELFPAFFLSAVEPGSIKVISDGSDGGVARLRVVGKPSEFLTSTALINQITIGSGLSFALDYALGPADDFLTITETMVNEDRTGHFFPSGQYPLPLGFIGLFGDGQPLFLPGSAGYDVRFQLEASYRQKLALPAFAGLTTDVLAVEGDGISYGLSYCPDCPSPFANAIAQQPGFVWHHRDQYASYQADLSAQSMLVPFISGTLFGLYLGEAPPLLESGKAISTTLKLRVSDGSPANVIDPVRLEKNADLVQLSGIVREDRSEEPVPFADVVVLRGSDATGLAETAAKADAAGRFHALVRPGSYVAIARLAPHPNSAPLPFTAAISEVYLEPRLGRTAYLEVSVSDETGRLVPAKISLDAAYDVQHANQLPRSFLYDFRLGDPYRPTDLVFDTADAETRRYLEATFRAVNGHAQGQVRPGKYRVTVSRGPAYSLDVQEIELVAGELTRVGAKVLRVLPRGNQIFADLHVHAQGSVDSDVLLDDRAGSFAAEGVDFLAMTEHNFLQDLQPTIDRLGLTDFVKSTVGVELTSLEAGHWNAYPLQYDAGAVTHGSVPWFRRNPVTLFDELRAAGKYSPDETVVQVNHPRDAIQGYFNAYGLTGEEFVGDPAFDWPGKAGTFAPSGPGFGRGTFSLDFDALEILTGKRFDLLRTFRVPLPPPPLPHPPPCSDQPTPGCMGPPGSVVRDAASLVAFPGALEDWEHLLDTGRRITAVGNSDSHQLIDGEGGYPRNQIDLGRVISSAAQIDEREVARAIKAGRVTVTDGPQLTLTALAQAPGGAEIPVGGLAQPDAAGMVRMHLVVDAAPWIDVTHAQLLVPGPVGCFRGDPCSRIAVGIDPATAGTVHRLDTVIEVRVPQGKDSWIAAEVTGQRGLWPVVIPYEIPSLLLTDAVGTVGSALGLKDFFGNLKPRQQTQMLPFALTNPVLIDGNGDGKWGLPPVVHLQAAPRDPAPAGQGDDAALGDLQGELGQFR